MSDVEMSTLSDFGEDVPKEESISVYVDSGCPGNNKQGEGDSIYWEFVVVEDGEEVYEETGDGSDIDVKYTSPTAEYIAIKKGLEYAKENYSKMEISVYSNAQPVVKQINGINNISKSHLRPLKRNVRKLMDTDDTISYKSKEKGKT